MDKSNSVIADGEGILQWIILTGKRIFSGKGQNHKAEFIEALRSKNLLHRDALNVASSTLKRIADEQTRRQKAIYDCFIFSYLGALLVVGIFSDEHALPFLITGIGLLFATALIWFFFKIPFYPNRNTTSQRVWALLNDVLIELDSIDLESKESKG